MQAFFVQTPRNRKGLHGWRSNFRLVASGGFCYFCGMAHDHHEPQQNEIGGPVVFALMMFAIVVMVIAFMAS